MQEAWHLEGNTRASWRTVQPDAHATAFEVFLIAKTVWDVMVRSEKSWWGMWMALVSWQGSVPHMQAIIHG